MLDGRKARSAVQGLIERIEDIETRVFKGRVKAINGLLIEAEGPPCGPDAWRQCLCRRR